MFRVLKAPGGETTFNAILFLGASLYSAYKGITLGNAFLLATALVAGTVGIGLWFRRSWARLLGLGNTLLWMALSVWFMSDRGITVWRLVFLAGLGLLAWDLWKERFEDNSDEESEDDDKLISIVLMLKEPRKLQLDEVKQMVLRAWGISLREDQEANEWIAEVGPSFGMKTRFGIYALHVAPQPYVDDQQEAADDMADLRLAKIIREHKAWYAVDLMEVGENTPAPEKAYPYIGHLLAELVDENCLGVYCPETQRLNPNTPELGEKLRGPDPLSDLTEPNELPVIAVPEDDPAMKAAVDEARGKWPEFLQAYNARDGHHFAVKAPITAGNNTEFIWIEVNKIDGETISGKLGNEPADLPGYKLGTPVAVKVSDLNDWLYLKGEEMQGGFTIKVVQAAMAKGTEATV